MKKIALIATLAVAAIGVGIYLVFFHSWETEEEKKAGAEAGEKIAHEYCLCLEEAEKNPEKATECEEMEKQKRQEARDKYRSLWKEGKKEAALRAKESWTLVVEECNKRKEE